MKVRLIKSFDFDCAHQLPCFPEGHKCRNLHGHTMRTDLVLEGELPEGQDYLIDFGEIKAIITPIREQLDHAYLNDIEDLGMPTVENISRWIWNKVKPDLPQLHCVRVHETVDNICEYYGE